MKTAILITGLLLSASAFSAVYESTQNGVPTFSNTKMNHAEKINGHIKLAIDRFLSNYLVF